MQLLPPFNNTMLVSITALPLPQSPPPSIPAPSTSLLSPVLGLLRRLRSNARGLYSLWQTSMFGKPTQSTSPNDQGQRVFWHCCVLSSIQSLNLFKGQPFLALSLLSEKVPQINNYVNMYWALSDVLLSMTINPTGKWPLIGSSSPTQAASITKSRRIIPWNVKRNSRVIT